MGTNLALALLKKCIFTLSWLVPRNANKAVLGCYKNRFADNSKYLFLHWQQTHFMQTIWISGDKALIHTLKQQGYTAHSRWSLLGIYHALTAKYYVYNSYIGDINQWLAAGAVRINLWHGSPLKKIEFDITTGPLAPKYQSRSLWHVGLQALHYHQEYVRPSLMLSPSPLVGESFQRAFRLKEDSLLTSTNPRTDYYLRYPEQRQTLPLKEDGTVYRRVILYAPSWRDALWQSNQHSIPHLAMDNADSPYQAAFDWQTLSQHLVDTDTLLLLRLHPNERHYAAQFCAYPNVLDISDWDDVYGILHRVDLLITDYSSLFIDVLPLEIPVLFYRFDHEQYLNQSRDCYDIGQDPLSIGQVAYQFDHLLTLLLEMSQLNTKPQPNKAYKQLQCLYWSQHASGLSADNLATDAISVDERHDDSFARLEQHLRQGQTQSFKFTFGTDIKPRI
ncbi:CDP-glycerol glycerophosphotransferase family protein [Shewanella mangrovisoli]|uniref:CDP-glycerol glycerophosphotransferase family protein n=1 Tax=Shewanella mangrovisoli TaxID=2864211 RepID=A0ABV4VK91_9GAMM